MLGRRPMRASSEPLSENMLQLDALQYARRTDAKIRCRACHVSRRRTISNRHRSASLRKCTRLERASQSTLLIDRAVQFQFEPCVHKPWLHRRYGASEHNREKHHARKHVAHLCGSRVGRHCDARPDGLIGAVPAPHRLTPASTRTARDKKQKTRRARSPCGFSMYYSRTR